MFFVKLPAPKCRDASTAVKGGFFTSLMHSRCRKSVGSVYLTLLGVWVEPSKNVSFLPDHQGVVSQAQLHQIKPYDLGG